MVKPAKQHHSRDRGLYHFCTPNSGHGCDIQVLYQLDLQPGIMAECKKKKSGIHLRVISGKERKIKERIELEIQRSNWSDFVTQVLVPTEKVYKIRNGKKVISERNILPGYILIEAVPSKFSGEMISTIANIPNVIHFLGKNNSDPDA